MRKIIFSILFLLTFSVFASDVDVFEIKMDRMPTDAEIKEVIDKYDFSKSQKELLFKETKKKLELIYQEQNAKQTTQPIQREKKYSNHPPLTRRSR